MVRSAWCCQERAWVNRIGVTDSLHSCLCVPPPYIPACVYTHLTFLLVCTPTLHYCLCVPPPYIPAYVYPHLTSLVCVYPHLTSLVCVYPHLTSLLFCTPTLHPSPPPTPTPLPQSARHTFQNYDDLNKTCVGY